MSGPLSFLRTGSGQAVILLHGLGRNAADVGPLAAALSPHYDVVSADLRGHGHSPDGRWTVAEAADDVAALAAVLGLESPVVVGHSLGGMVAAELAARDGLLRAAVNLDGHGAGLAAQQSALPGPAVRSLLARRRAEALSQIPEGPLTAEALKAARDGIAASGSDHLTEVLDRSLDPTGSFRPSRTCVAEVLDDLAELDLLQLYRRTTVPLLVVRATRLPADDPMARDQALWLSEALAAACEDQSLLRVAELDADHALISTATAATAAVVLDFLAGSVEQRRSAGWTGPRGSG